MSQSQKSRWKIVLTVVTFVALVALVYFVRKQIVDTIENLGKVNTWALPLMIVWQILNYHSYAKLYKGFFAILGEKIRYRSLYRVALELNFVNNIFPSGGVSGFSYFSMRMKDAGVSTAKSTLVQITRFIMVFIAFQVFLVLGLLMLALGGHVSNLTILVAGSLATLLFVGSVGIAFVIGSQRRINAFFTFITKFVNKLIHFFRHKNPETIEISRVQRVFTELHENYLLLKANPKALKQPFLWGLVANLTEVLTIYTVYVAFGHWVNPGAVILGYAVANFAGVMSVLPGGVGIYEALMTGVMAAAGVSPGLTIPVTIMYRVLNMLIQLPPGYYYYYKRLHTNLPAPTP